MSCFYHKLGKDGEIGGLMDSVYSVLGGVSWQLLDEAVNLGVSLADLSGPRLEAGEKARFLMNLLSDYGYDNTLTDDAGNVIGMIRGQGNGNSVLFLSHLNAICPNRGPHGLSAGKSGNPRNEGNRDTGKNRCGASMAAQIMAGIIVKRSGIPLDGDLIVGSTIVENGGLCPGIRILMNDTLPYLDFRPKLVVIAAPTGLRVMLSHAGRIDLDINVSGDNPFSVHEAAWSMADALRRLKPHEISPEGTDDLIIESPIFAIWDKSPRAIIRMSVRVQVSEKIYNIYAKIKEHVSLIARTFSGTRATCDIRRENFKLYTGKEVCSLHAIEPWFLDWFDPQLNRPINSLLSHRCALSMGKWNLESPCVHMAASILINEYKIPTICYGPDCHYTSISSREKSRAGQMARALLGMSLLIYEIAGATVIEWKT